MTTRITVWGTEGRIFADRQEMPGLPARHGAVPPRATSAGWNVRYTTELTEPVWFYLRGEEYSAQIEHFVEQRARRRTSTASTTSPSAAVTDRVIAMMIADAEQGRVDTPQTAGAAPAPRRRARRRLPIPRTRRSPRSPGGLREP